MTASPVRPAALSLILVGIIGGVFSGLFGIGGGTIIVPALALWLSMPHKLSAGTSVAAILPAATVGAISYAVQGNVDWLAAVLLAVGIVAGAQLGSHLLAKLPVNAIKWFFMIFLAVVIVSLWFVVPQRDDVIHIDVIGGVMLVAVGFITGILSGLLGVGGGIVIVPVLMFFFGANDLVAKGTSLVMMIPGSLSATLGNFRRKNVDLRAAAYVGLTAAACAPFGTILAAQITPSVGNVLFSLYIAFVLGQMLFRQLRKPKP